jgi:hypothetical protein
MRVLCPYNSWPIEMMRQRMMIGLAILAVLTFIAVGEIRRTVGEPVKGED